MRVSSLSVVKPNPSKTNLRLTAISLRPTEPFFTSGRESSRASPIAYAIAPLLAGGSTFMKPALTPFCLMSSAFVAIERSQMFSLIRLDKPA